MWLTRITVTAAIGSAAVDCAELLVDAIWAVARPEDGLEHLSVRSGPKEIFIGLFARPDGDLSSEDAVLRLMERATELSPPFRDWNVADVRSLPLPDLLTPLHRDTPRENDP